MKNFIIIMAGWFTGLFRDKKKAPPCICGKVKRQEDCLVHFSIHMLGKYKSGCPYCNYDDVKYQSEVKLKN
jgi:hypothetical protein